MSVTIENGGFLTTVQDMGRIGFQEFGIPVSGVMDKKAAKIANILVGNPMESAVLEATIIGPQIRFNTDNTIAITGGSFEPHINGKRIPEYQAVSAKKGDVLSFLGNKTGCRCYIAFAGSLDIPIVMGSKSTYLKAKLGGFEGRKLKNRDILKFTAPNANLPNLKLRWCSGEQYPNEIEVRVIMGPQDNAFTKKGTETFLNSVFDVSNECDRMGYRLEGPAIEHKEDGNIISDGIAFGAIQVPSQGNPIIMMSDRQSIGGYTKIANVISVDLPKVAQAKMGNKIRFKAVDIREAQDLYIKEIEALKRIESKILDNSKKYFSVVVNGLRYEVAVEEIM